MAVAKRIFLFIVLNFLVIFMITIVLNLLNVRPYFDAYGINYSELMIFCLVWGMGGAFISLALSIVMAKWMMGVKLIDPETRDPEQRHLLETVRDLSINAGLPSTPQVGIYRSNDVNAFATGPTRNRALVAVSSGLLSRMKEDEVKAILGHEVSHVANGDMVTMTLLQGVVNAFVMFLARVLAYVVSGFGKNRESNSGGSVISYMLFVYLFEVVFMILGSLVICAFSRWREFRADRGGARLAGKESMISALQTLGALKEVKDPKEQPAMAAFKISHPGKKGFLSLFSTHPPLEERIERLKKGL